MSGKIFFMITFAHACLFLPVYAVQDPIVFPREGQTREQQQKDKEYCSSWAKDESGVDPSYVKAKLDMTNDSMANQAAASSGVGRQVLRGAAVGAAMGGLDDAIDSKAGGGAAKGAVLMMSRAREQNRQAQQQQVIQNEYAKKAQLEQEYGKFQRAFCACMEAKGYSVK